MRTFLYRSFGALGALALALASAGCGDDDSSSSSTTSDTSTTSASATSSGSSGSGGEGGSGSTGSTGSGSGAGGAGGGSADVTGTLIDTHFWEAGEVDAPTSGQVSVEALIPGAGGAFTSIPGTLNPDGTFVIPGVPDGTYYLKYTRDAGTFPYIVVTSSRTVELGSWVSGRPDAKVATMPTPLTLNVSGLAPWDDQSSLEIYAQGGPTWDPLSYAFDPPPTPGDTELMGATADVSLFSAPGLVDGSKGDLAYLTQLTTRDAGGMPYSSVGKVLKPAPFTQGDGQAVILYGSFEDAPQKQLKLDWKRSTLASLAMTANPNAAITDQSVSIYSEQGGAGRSTASASPSLLSLSTAESTDVTVDLSYGDPFPAAWAPVVTVGVSYGFKVTPPGFQNARTLTGATGVSKEVTSGAQLADVPAVGPPQSVMINGMPATGPLQGVGDAPALSWSAPLVGTPSSYRVLVRRIDPALPSRTVAQLRTAGTSVTIPAGILKKGDVYYIRLASETDVVDLNKPGKRGTSGSYADALTSYFTL